MAVSGKQLFLIKIRNLKIVKSFRTDKIEKVYLDSSNSKKLLDLPLDYLVKKIMES